MSLGEELPYMIAYQLRARREALEMTQEEVAQKLGMSQSAIAKIEAGTLDTPLARLVQMAAIYKTSVMEIMEAIAPAEHSPSAEQKELRRGFFGNTP
jgi:predicted transcriptional regulator